jgi:hypothetical protein
MGNKNNIDSLSNYNISSTGKNYLKAVKKGMKILSNKLENNQNNIYKALEKKYFDKIINFRKIQSIKDLNKLNNINWKNYILHYFNSRINENEYFSNIFYDIQNESFLSENKYVSSAFFKEFELLTEPENLEIIDKNLNFNDDKEIDKDEILTNNLKQITYNDNMKDINFSTSKINLSNLTVNLGGSFNNENSINDEVGLEYKMIRNRIKAIMKIWKRHLKNNDHPIRIVVSIYEKHFTHYIIEEKKKLKKNEIKNFNDDIIEEIHKFILKCQSTLKLMYSQSFDFLCLSEEKDETINLITNCLFETGNLYDEIYNLYQIELAKNIEDYSKKIKVLENINPQNLNIPDKFCLNNLTEEYKNNLKKNNNNEFTLSGINNTDNNKERNEILNEINTNKRTSVIEEIEIKKEGYKSAINLLKGLKHKKTPFEKMMIIATISTEIIKCVNNYWKGMEHYISSTLLNITADELMAIFIFIVIKSQMSDLLIHKKIIFDFTTKNIKQSTIGYYNITLEGAVEYILNCAIQELGFEEEFKHINDDNKCNTNVPFSIED